MRYKVTKFKSLKVALQELRKFIENGDVIQSGKPVRRFEDMRPRELVANWLLCATINFELREDCFTFLTDPTGGDGILHNSKTGDSVHTEHVFVPKSLPEDESGVEDKILHAIQDKQNKGGKAYAEGKTLIVFTNSDGGEWFPNKVAKSLPKPLDFNDVWVICLQSVVADRYIYGITRLDLSEGKVPIWLLFIFKTFDDWKVIKIQ